MYMPKVGLSKSRDLVPKKTFIASAAWQLDMRILPGSEGPRRVAQQPRRADAVTVRVKSNTAKLSKMPTDL